MDALAAVALAGNVAQFIEYAITLVLKTPEILNSSDHMFKEVSEIKCIIEDVEQSLHSISLSAPRGQKETRSDKTLDDLTRRCLAISNEIMTIVDNLKLKIHGHGPASIIQGTAIAVKSLSKMSKLEQLTKRLYELRDQVSAHLIILIR